MAAQNFKGATTIHQWSGISDNRFQKEKLLTCIEEETKKRIREADVLVIDEIGMVSACVFEKLEFVTRNVRQSLFVFGGLQVICCGDFLQLPPVPDPLHLDPGEYCFTAESFKKAFPHWVNLTEVKRQPEPKLTNAVAELCWGNPTPDTRAFMRSFDRPIKPQEEQPTVLFGVNFDVDYYNQNQLDNMEGQSKVYRALDQGEKGLLKGSQAAQLLVLKEGAPVIILKNLSSTLVNGTLGTVHSLEKDKPEVDFGGKLYTLERANFEVYDSQTNTVRACRCQFPLKLAFALTVHKAQGQGISNLEVDCFSFFAPGQLGVAIGRAISTDKLRVRNYNPAVATLKHPPHVYEFYKSYENQSNQLQDCCCSKQHLDSISCDSQNQSSLLVECPSMLSQIEVPLCHRSKFNAIEDHSCTKTFHSNPETVNFGMERFPPPADIEVEVSRFNEYCCIIYSTLDSIMPNDREKKESWTEAFGIIHSYFLSIQFKDALSKLFGKSSINQKENRYGTSLALELQKTMLERRAANITTGLVESQNSNQTEINVSPSIKAKIRYIGGACFSQVSKRLKTKSLSNLTNTDLSELRKQSFQQHRLLSQLRLNETDVIATTSTPESLTEIENKQSSSRGLFHVTDGMFDFFIELYRQVSVNLTSDRFNLYSANTYSKCRENVFSDEKLMATWTAQFKHDSHQDEAAMEMSERLVHELFFLIVEHFVRISFVDALHYMKEKLPRTKKQALRAKIQGATKMENGNKKRRCDNSI